METEESIGVLGTPVDQLPKGADGIHIMPGARRLSGDQAADVPPPGEEEKRADLKDRITANAAADDPHRHYFVPYPEL